MLRITNLVEPKDIALMHKKQPLRRPQKRTGSQSTGPSEIVYHSSTDETVPGDKPKTTVESALKSSATETIEKTVVSNETVQVGNASLIESNNETDVSTQTEASNVSSTATGETINTSIQGTAEAGSSSVQILMSNTSQDITTAANAELTLSNVSDATLANDSSKSVETVSGASGNATASLIDSPSNNTEETFLNQTASNIAVEERANITALDGSEKSVEPKNIMTKEENLSSANVSVEDDGTIITRLGTSRRKLLY
ncbi:unnamed protein product [Enterobius vermicularis]|uniref:Uncharacterized protein n=1 Tax=Enterobius vermicularis TaxID=51028 RepID=A0A0N4VEK3_ENTVE|nr:unnamed protein product [Enterobius vermicularis]